MNPSSGMELLKDIDVKSWAICFSALMKKSSELTQKLSERVENPVFKVILRVVSLEHSRIAELIKLIFEVEDVSEDAYYSSRCKKLLGEAIIDRIKQACAAAASIMASARSREDVDRLIAVLKEAHDLTKGMVLTLSKVADWPLSRLLTYVASILEQNALLVRDLLEKAFEVV